MAKNEDYKVECVVCGHTWNYRGKSKYYITCPDCRSNLNLSQYVKCRDDIHRHTKVL